jgi:hypothetical protein
MQNDDLVQRNEIACGKYILDTTEAYLVDFIEKISDFNWSNNERSKLY